MNEIQINSHNLIIIKNGDRKDYFMIDIIKNIYNLSKIDNYIIFSAKEKSGKYSYYEDIIPRKNIFYLLDENIIDNIIDKQKKSIEENSNEKLCIIFDICLYSNKIWDDKPTLLDFLINAKKYNITYFITVSFPLSFKPEIRNNFDHIFVFSSDTVSRQKRIYEHYCNKYIIHNFKFFYKLFNQITSDYYCMIIDNSSNQCNNNNDDNHNDISDVQLKNIFKYYKVKDNKNKKICKKYFNMNDPFYEDIYTNNYKHIECKKNNICINTNNDSDVDSIETISTKSSNSFKFSRKTLDRTNKINLLGKIIEINNKIVNLIEKI